MKLNHLDLQVADIDAASAFFERFFGLHCIHRREGEIALLKDDAGTELGLSNLRHLPPPQYPPDFHVGFIQESTAEVNAIYTRIKDAGVPIKFELQEAGPNLAFQCVAPGSIVVEVRAPRSRN